MTKKRGIMILIIFGVFFLAQNLESAWTTKRLTWNSGASYSPAIATDSYNHIHVVWYDNTPGNTEIFYKKSTDGGANWLALKRLTWNSGDSSTPAIAVGSNNHIHVVWLDYTPGNYEIFYKKSTDGGTTWTASKRLTWNSGSSKYPAIAVGSNNHIHVVWLDDTPGNYEIFYKKSTTGGTNWSTERLTWNSGGSYSPTIAADSYNHIHVVWTNYTLGNPEIFYKQSTDEGANWSTKRLTWNSGSSFTPAIAIDSNNHIHVVWMDSTPVNHEIFYIQSTNGGANWSQKRLTWNSGISGYPAIAVDTNNHIHVLWEDDTPGNYEIFYKNSTNGGANWSTERLTWNSGGSHDPAIASDINNHILVVWHDYMPGNQEIFYKKKD